MNDLQGYSRSSELSIFDKPHIIYCSLSVVTTSLFWTFPRYCHFYRWRGGAMSSALDLRSTGPGFNSYSGQNLRNNLGQVVHICVPLSPSSITGYRPSGGDALRLGR